jgi:hypothetical protein
MRIGGILKPGNRQREGGFSPRPLRRMVALGIELPFQLSNSELIDIKAIIGSVCETVNHMSEK